MQTNERINAMNARIKEATSKIYDWETVTEDEDRTYAEELQTLSLLEQMLNHEPPLLTAAGLDYADECIARSNEWINEKLAEQGND